MKDDKLPKTMSKRRVTLEDGSVFEQTIFDGGAILIDPIRLSAERRKQLCEINRAYGEAFEKKRDDRLAQEREVVKSFWDFTVN